MATKLYFGSLTPVSYSLGQFWTRLDGVDSGWHLDGLGLLKGSAVASRTVTSVAGPTSGIEVFSTSSPNTTSYHYISPPLAADVTVSAAMVVNLWGLEGNGTANAGFMIVVERIVSAGEGGGNTETGPNVITSEHGTELATSVELRNWTTGTPTSTNFKVSDRIRIRVAFNDAGGTMGAGNVLTFRRGGTTDAADGDSWIEFAETLTFLDESTTPSGDVLYLRSTAAAINPGTNTERQLTSGRGGSAATATGVLGASNGPTSPIDTKNEWYSDPVDYDFTASGETLFNARLKLSASSNTAWPRAVLRRTESDGSSPVVLGAGAPGGSSLTTTEAVRSIWIPIKPTSFVIGQRLLLNVYYDDGDNASYSTIATTDVGVDGPTANANGDSWLALPFNLIEPPDPIIGEAKTRQGISPLRWR